MERRGKGQPVATPEVVLPKQVPDIASFAEEKLSDACKERGCSAVSAPRVVDLLITGRCNLDCPFCFSSDPGIGQMSCAEAHMILQTLKKYGARWVVLSGGEPTLVPSAVSSKPVS